MTPVLDVLVRAQVHLAGYPADNPPPPTNAPGNGGAIDFGKFTPNGNAVPKSGLFVSMGQGALWLAFALSFVALAAGVLMWVAGPIFGSQYAAQAGKTQMWKGIAGVVIAASAASLCTWVVGLVSSS